jgi:hypothetical protein
VDGNISPFARPDPELRTDPLELQRAAVRYAAWLPSQLQHETEEPIELTRAARDGYSRERAYRKKELVEIDAWLRAHARDGR